MTAWAPASAAASAQRTDSRGAVRGHAGHDREAGGDAAIAVGDHAGPFLGGQHLVLPQGPVRGDPVAALGGQPRDVLRVAVEIGSVVGLPRQRGRDEDSMPGLAVIS